MVNYQKLMALNPTSLGRMINDKSQTIEFFENPIYGDEAEVIVVCHKLQLANHSSFMETNDMTASHGEYQPKFINGKLFIGEFEQD